MFIDEGLKMSNSKQKPKGKTGGKPVKK